ncbi:MAG: hypothetical protein KVP17_001512 [Porospora cf. gigantea B]|uniref:uncharacterized protein n=1 Tax=Porospora cf. gigantea B TaxID=2853592 RepID=UPI003571CA8E|nr:MAG: hypothetical protein KVP17_001512 [Porospora cf. gigantea B]
MAGTSFAAPLPLTFLVTGLPSGVLCDFNFCFRRAYKWKSGVWSGVLALNLHRVGLHFTSFCVLWVAKQKA